MCALHVTHSGRQIPCNAARDYLNCCIIDLKAWTEIWDGRSQAILPRISLSPLPLSRFFASHLAWTCLGNSCLQQRARQNPMETSATAALTLGVWQGTIKQQQGGSHQDTLAEHWPGILQQPALVCMTSWSDFSHLTWGLQNWSQVTSTGRSAVGQENPWHGDKPWNPRRTGESPSRPLRPGLSSQSLTSAVVLSMRAEGRFCCPYSSNSSNEIFSLGSCCLWLWHKAALPAGETHQKTTVWY